MSHANEPTSDPAPAPNPEQDRQIRRLRQYLDVSVHYCYTWQEAEGILESLERRAIAKFRDKHPKTHTDYTDEQILRILQQ